MRLVGGETCCGVPDLAVMFGVCERVLRTDWIAV
jgi:hypothetical protein